jgi:L-malate glycosyltransferase
MRLARTGPHRKRPLNMRNRKPTICQLLHGPSLSSSESAAIQLACGLKSSFNFIFAYIDAPTARIEELRRAGLSAHRIPWRPGPDRRYDLWLVRLLNRERVDLVHAHQPASFYYGLLARLVYRRPPVLRTEHERRQPDASLPDRVLANRLLVEDRDRFVAACQWLRQGLVLNEGLPPGQVEVVYPGIAPPRDGDTGEDGSSVRRRIGVGADDLLIVQIAPFDPAQDYVFTIRTFRQVVAEVPRARLALLGDGPDKKMIQDLVRAMGLETCVVFLDERTDRARLLAAADIVMTTGLRDNLSALIQAMAAGRPVAATRVGGVGEVVEDRVCGLLVCPGDYGELAEKIRLMARDEGLRKRLGRMGAERAATMFSEVEATRRYSEIYWEMLSVNP